MTNDIIKNFIQFVEQKTKVLFADDELKDFINLEFTKDYLALIQKNHSQEDISSFIEHVFPILVRKEKENIKNIVKDAMKKNKIIFSRDIDKSLDIFLLEILPHITIKKFETIFQNQVIYENSILKNNTESTNQTIYINNLDLNNDQGVTDKVAKELFNILGKEKKSSESEIGYILSFILNASCEFKEEKKNLVPKKRLEFFDKIKLFCRGGPLCEKTKLAPSTNNQLDNILDISAEKRDLQK